MERSDKFGLIVLVGISVLVSVGFTTMDKVEGTHHWFELIVFMLFTVYAAIIGASFSNRKRVAAGIIWVFFVGILVFGGFGGLVICRSPLVAWLCSGFSITYGCMVGGIPVIRGISVNR